MKINPIIFTFISNYHEHFTYLKNVFSKLTYFLELITKIAFNVMLKYIMLKCIYTILCHEEHACASSVVCIYIYTGRKGTMGCLMFITLVPKAL